jgi:sulfite reductase (NADPH) flavoprotein alpha-component
MKVPVVPESAPFTAEQRQWLNGFLAGLANISAGASVGAPAGSSAATGNTAVTSAPARRVHVLYGSQSGNAEGLAHALAGKLKAADAGGAPLDPLVLGLEKFREVDWKSAEHVLIVTSTWGEGDMPDNAVAFWDWLKGPEAPALPRLHYSVLGLGDRNYARFCQAGKQLDARFAELGAKRLVPFCECDADYEAGSEAWMKAARAALDAQPQAEPDPSNGAHANGHLNGHIHVAGAPSQAAPAPGNASVTVSAPAAHGKKNPFSAPLLENHPLNAKGSEKDTRHISLSLLGSGLEYKVGDALGIYPRNCYDLVDRIILALNCLGNEKVTPEGGEEMTLRAALLSRLDLRRAPPKLMERLAEACANPGEKRRAGDLLSDGAKLRAYLDGKDVLDVLEDFPHTRLDARHLAGSLGKLAPRLYSISSSPKENPGEVHLTVGVVRYMQGNRRRRGVASSYLAERVPLGMAVPVFVQPASHFTIPTQSGTPIIMVGPGTGIAPFRAFLQERRCLGDAGKNWLFFGDQRRRFDFLYGEEFVAWHESGFLTRMDLAFSRDQEEKVYVQQRMLEQGKELWAWLEEGAHFYVCGDAKRMAKDVEEALLKVVAREGCKSPEEAKAYLDGMKAQKRYQRDVY